MAKEIGTIIRDDVEFELINVKYQTKDVGKAPVKAYEDCDDMIASLSKETVFGLAIRQRRTDCQNAVRAKFNKDKVSASTIISAIGSGMLTPEMQAEAIRDMNTGKAKNFTEACARFLGIGEDALKDVNPETIHWDCKG